MHVLCLYTSSTLCVHSTLNYVYLAYMYGMEVYALLGNLSSALSLLGITLLIGLGLQYASLNRE